MIRVNVKTNIENAVEVFQPMRQQRAAYALASQMLADMTKYVPRREGFLQMSGHVSADIKSLIWRTPYAKAQYYGGNGRTQYRNYTTPGTGKRWDLTAEANHMKSWERVYLNAMGL